MAVYAKGARFMASVGAGPERVRKTFPTEEGAQAWERSQEKAREAVRTAAPSIWTLQQCFDRAYRDNWRGKGGEGKAVLNATQALDFFGPGTPTDEINANWIVEWMDELADEHENSGSTRNKKLSALRVMLSKALKYGNLPKLPETTRAKESEHRIHWFSDEDEATMLHLSAHLGLPLLTDFIILGLDTGYRKGELKALRMTDYHHGKLILHAGATKNGMARSVPCTPRVAAVLDARKAGGATELFPEVTGSGLRRMWEQLRAAMGRLEDPAFIPHVMRHTCATRLVAAGAPLNVVQAWMGHKTITTTMRYVHLGPSQLDAAMALLTKRKDT